MANKYQITKRKKEILFFNIYAGLITCQCVSLAYYKDGKPVISNRHKLYQKAFNEIIKPSPNMNKINHLRKLILSLNPIT